MNDKLVIGIAGKSGSGKTTVCKEISDFLEGKNVTIIQYDDYYNDHSHIDVEKRKDINFDHPDAFNTELLISDINKLINNEDIQIYEYDFKNHIISNNKKVLESKNVIIVEGLFTLLDERLLNLLDLKIFVDTDDDECFIRRLERDTIERGRSQESITNQYKKFVKPMCQRYIEPTKKKADIIILQGGNNYNAIKMIGLLIKNFLNTKGE